MTTFDLCFRKKNDDWVAVNLVIANNGSKKYPVFNVVLSDLYELLEIIDSVIRNKAKKKIEFIDGDELTIYGRENDLYQLEFYIEKEVNKRKKYNFTIATAELLQIKNKIVEVLKTYESV